jgi:hypothetical protein
MRKRELQKGVMLNEKTAPWFTARSQETSRFNRLTKADHDAPHKPSGIVESISVTTREGWLVLKRP